MSKKENLTDDELYDLMTEELFIAIGWIKPDLKKRSKGEKKNSKKEKKLFKNS